MIHFSKKQTIFLFITMLIIMINCAHQKKVKVTEYIRILSEAGFDRNSWINDTLGCNPITKDKNAKIFANQDFITKCTESDAIEILGKPNRNFKRENLRELYYIIDGRLTCEIFKKKCIVVDGESSFFIISINEKGYLDNVRITIR